MNMCVYMYMHSIVKNSSATNSLLRHRFIIFYHGKIFVILNNIRLFMAMESKIKETYCVPFIKTLAFYHHLLFYNLIT